MSATGQGVVVTGMGATTPLGGDVATTWAAMLAGESGVRPLKHAGAEQLRTPVAPEAVPGRSEKAGTAPASEDVKTGVQRHPPGVGAEAPDKAPIQ